MSQKPFESHDEHWPALQEAVKPREGGNGFDLGATIGGLHAADIREVYERQQTFDPVASTVVANSERNSRVFEEQYLPFDPSWAIESFAQVTGCAAATLCTAIEKLSTPCFAEIETEIENTVVPIIWESDFGEKVVSASKQQRSRDDAIVSCFSVDRDLISVKDNLRSLELLVTHVSSTSSQLLPHFSPVSNALNSAHSNCVAVLVDRCAACKILANLLRWAKPFTMLGNLLESLPRPRNDFDVERSLKAAVDCLGAVSSALATPPFSKLSKHE